jgi:hypothetical protein
MTLTANVVDGQIILASWGNTIRDRTIQRFATVAERDAQWPAATAGSGAVCVTVDTGTECRSNGTVWAAAIPAVRSCEMAYGSFESADITTTPAVI